MAQQNSFHIPLSDPDRTVALGHAIAPVLRPGDTLLLTGTLGAGKSHLARAIIRARLGREEDVPSPTFTLVQTYDHAEGDLWHADLYRLSHPDEVIELGLDEAFETAIALVEWPDRLGDLVPADPIRVELRYDGEGRMAEITFVGRPDLADCLMDFTK
ncbi:tRNA (adenosine(37)-N6)-threonylcarbamoyltransferase complex ATPase subunit type 1 TsaE [Thioclava sp. FR2]|uniref:tRNA (adenosine(37)-N6)-threonylcarbamoyltransferase complex ATPase subunit type 1 TsaE n=1 Tax=Thioclava sp. FR2 TaxID=3445780 RepID=UPI003EBCB17B